MENHHISTQLKQLLKRGYSIEDARTLLNAPEALVDKVILEYLDTQNLEQQTLLSQQSQARYAMMLGR